MAALAITTSQFHLISGPTEQGTSGEALTRGQAAYQAADNKYYKAKAHLGTAIQATARGLVLEDVGVGDPVLIARPGAIVDLGAAALAALTSIAYYLGATAGSLYPVADVASADYVSIVCFNHSGHLVTVLCYNSGALLP